MQSLRVVIACCCPACWIVLTLARKAVVLQYMSTGGILRCHDTELVAVIQHGHRRSSEMKRTGRSRKKLPCAKLQASSSCDTCRRCTTCARSAKRGRARPPAQASRKPCPSCIRHSLDPAARAARPPLPPPPPPRPLQSCAACASACSARLCTPTRRRAPSCGSAKGWSSSSTCCRNKSGSVKRSMLWRCGYRRTRRGSSPSSS